MNFAVGTVHRNRLGYYTILEILNGKALIEYESGDHGSAEVEILERIEDNIQREDYRQAPALSTTHDHCKSPEYNHPNKHLIELQGIWRKGYAISEHTISSVFTGDDTGGHPAFLTDRSEIGSMVYEAKYKQNYNSALKLAEIIIEKVEKLRNFDTVIPAPFSNVGRQFQIVNTVAKLFCKKLSIPFVEDVFASSPHQELKTITDPDQRLEILRESITLKNIPDISNKNILIFDDVFRSGSTLTALCELLLPLSPKNICILTMTKTRSLR